MSAVTSKPAATHAFRSRCARWTTFAANRKKRLRAATGLHPPDDEHTNVATRSAKAAMVDSPEPTRRASPILQINRRRRRERKVISAPRGHGAAGIIAAALMLLTSTFIPLRLPSAGNSMAASSAGPAFGVQFHGTWFRNRAADRRAILDALAAAKVQWIRLDLDWTLFEERGPGVLSDWYVQLADSVVDEATARGLNVLATPMATPGWANSGQGVSVPPTDLAQYARFVGWAAAHFRGRVAAWEVWNEPNLDEFWSGTDPVLYAAMLRLSYPRIRAGDPKAIVVLGAPSYNDIGWLSAVYEAGAEGSFDVMATHPYMAPSDLPPETPDNGTIWNLTHVHAVHDLMARYGDQDKKIWFTEFGWSSHANSGAERPWQRGVTRDQQADYMVRTLQLVSTRYRYVTHVFWYTDRDRLDGDVHLNNFGLLAHDLRPKPAYTALSRILPGNSPDGRPSCNPIRA